MKPIYVQTGCSTEVDAESRPRVRLLESKTRFMLGRVTKGHVHTSRRLGRVAATNTSLSPSTTASTHHPPHRPYRARPSCPLPAGHRDVTKTAIPASMHHPTHPLKAAVAPRPPANSMPSPRPSFRLLRPASTTLRRSSQSVRVFPFGCHMVVGR